MLSLTMLPTTLIRGVSIIILGSQETFPDILPGEGAGLNVYDVADALWPEPNHDAAPFMNSMCTSIALYTRRLTSM
jgi:hypothetical protein